jgi:5-formyltetrahydrofolate cyclo-ligase
MAEALTVRKQVLRREALATRSLAHATSATEQAECLAQLLLELLEARVRELAEAAARPAYLAGMYDEPAHLPTQRTEGDLWPARPINDGSLAAQLSPTLSDEEATRIARDIQAEPWPNVPPDVLAWLKRQRAAEQAAALEAEAEAARVAEEQQDAAQRTIRIAAYAAVDSEISLAPFARLVDQGLADGTRVLFYAPIVLHPHHMEFVQVSAQELADPASSGLDFLVDPVRPARRPADRRFEPCGNLDFILVPGLAFDAQGNRLGFGGGFYDAYLSMYRAQLKWAGQDMGSWPQPRPSHETRAIGVCFPEQVVEAGVIPMGYNDQMVDLVLTSAGLVSA